MERLYQDAAADVDYAVEDAELENPPTMKTEDGITQICLSMKGIDGKKKLTVNTSKLESKLNSI